MNLYKKMMSLQEFKNKNPSGGVVVNNVLKGEKIEISSVDFFYLIDKLILVQNDNKILRMRLTLMDSIVKWCLNYITFVYSFSTILFQNNLPVSAVIFNSDLLNIPFKLITNISTNIKTYKTYLYDTYEAYRFLNISIGKEINSMNSPPVPDFDELEAYTAKIRADYDQFVFDFNKTDTPSSYAFMSFFKHVPENQRDLLNERLEKVMHEFNLPFSPQFIIKQNFVGELLMFFATSIFRYVPQLKIDFQDKFKLQYTIENYVKRLADFWDTQVNLCVEPYHKEYEVNYQATNMFKFSTEEITEMYRAYFENRDVDYLDMETKMLLHVKHRTPKLTFMDPTNQQISDIWRELFADSITKMEDDERKTLFESYVTYMANTTNIFDKKIMNKMPRVYMPTEGDCLTDLKYTYYEQLCFAKLIIKFILMRSKMLKCPQFAGHDPLSILVQEFVMK